jgi:hypothetical protein
MRICWSVDEVGAMDRYLTIDDGEFEGLTEQERETLINEYVQEAFDDKICFYWKIVDD